MVEHLDALKKLKTQDKEVLYEKVEAFKDDVFSLYSFLAFANALARVDAALLLKIIKDSENNVKMYERVKAEVLKRLRQGE